MNNLGTKKIGVFLLLAFLQMIAIGLFLYYGNVGDIAEELAVIGSMFTPLLSVIFTQLLFKEPVLRGLGINFKFNNWWIWGWVLIPVLSLVVLGLSLLVPEAHLSNEVLDELTEDAPVRMNIWGFVGVTIVNGLLTGATINALAAFGEEIGWRGFLVRELAGKKFLWAALFIGVVWGAWHFPLILNGLNYPDHPIAGVFMMIVMCVCLTPIFLYFRLKGHSVIVPAIMHGTFNAMIQLANVLVMPMNDLVIGVAGLVGIIALLLFDIVLFLYDRFISQERLFTKPLAP